jgi:hypothetical protein
MEPRSLVCNGDKNKFDELKRRFPDFFRLFARYQRLFSPKSIFSKKILRGHYYPERYPLVEVPKTPLPMQNPAE